MTLATVMAGEWEPLECGNTAGCLGGARAYLAPGVWRTGTMDERAQRVIATVRENMGCRDNQLVVAAIHGAKVLLQGPRRVSARRMSNLCLQHGKMFSVVYSAPAAEGPVVHIADSQWHAPVAPETSSTNEATVLLWASKAGLAATTAVPPDRVAGCTSVVTVTATGEVTANAISNLLALRSVVNIFFSAGSFDVYFAKDTGLIGGLGHIGATKGYSGLFRSRRTAARGAEKCRTRRRRRRVLK